MNTCSCGNLVDSRYKQCPRCEAVAVLGIAPDAPEMEIRSAYRLLAKAWNPEKFQDDQKLKEAAEEKQKDITTAFYFLTATSTEHSRDERPCYVSRGKTSEVQSAPGKVSASSQAPVFNPRASSLMQSGDEIKTCVRIWPKLKLFLKIAALICAFFLGGSIWTGFRGHNTGSTQAANAKVSDPRAGEETPVETFLDEIKKDLESLDPRESAQSTDPQTDQPASRNVTRVQTGKIHTAASNVQPAANIIRPYVTVGSTRDEVLAQQGTPTASSEDKLIYGKSELYFKNGAVAGWRIDPDSSAIRVKVWPQYTINPSPEYFTVGSSRDTVLAVQGTPTALTEDKYEYGGSEVDFRNNKVVGWKNDPASTPLRAR